MSNSFFFLFHCGSVPFLVHWGRWMRWLKMIGTTRCDLKMSDGWWGDQEVAVLHTHRRHHLSNVSQCHGVIGGGRGHWRMRVPVWHAGETPGCRDSHFVFVLFFSTLTLKELSTKEALNHWSDERVDSPRSELSQTIRLIWKGGAIPVSEEQRTNSRGLFFSAAGQLWTREF